MNEDGGIGVPEQIKIYQGDRMETRSLSAEQGFSCGDGCGYDYAFPQGSCGGSGVRFFFQNGVWQSFCRGAVLCEGKQTAGRILQGGELFVLNAAAHFAVQFLKDTGADAENIGSTPKLVDWNRPGWPERRPGDVGWRK